MSYPNRYIDNLVSQNDVGKIAEYVGKFFNSKIYPDQIIIEDDELTYLEDKDKSDVTRHMFSEFVNSRFNPITKQYEFKGDEEDYDYEEFEEEYDEEEEYDDMDKIADKIDTEWFKEGDLAEKKKIEDKEEVKEITAMIVILVGPSNCGKSTVAKELIMDYTWHAERLSPPIRINRDSLREILS
jgi:ABC-type glutathione transport system ATPase component